MVATVADDERWWNRPVTLFVRRNAPRRFLGGGVVGRLGYHGPAILLTVESHQVRFSSWLGKLFMRPRCVPWDKLSSIEIDLRGLSLRDLMRPAIRFHRPSDVPFGPRLVFAARRSVIKRVVVELERYAPGLVVYTPG